MATVVPDTLGLQVLNHFLLSVFLLVPMVLIARTVVAGTRYSPILIIVIFGLTMGYVLVASGVSVAGLPDFPLIDLISKTTVVALTVSFFVGGQELRKLFGKLQVPPDTSVVYSQEETVMGTTRTQLVLIVRALFLLVGIEALTRLLVGHTRGPLGTHYLLIAYLGLVAAVILIDYKATVANKPRYIRKGVLEIAAIFGVLAAAFQCSRLVQPLIALPQIFFAMVLAATLGAVCYRWRHGPTVRCLLFAGIPVVLAGNFMIGGSRIADAFAITGMNAVLAYGFFGQLFWMFGGIALLMYLGKTAQVRNLAPGMAGALSHSGLTGACTAGDLGEQAARRAPIMINVPFFGHIFVFSILAVSAEREGLWLWPSLLIAVAGIGFVVAALRTLARAGGVDAVEVKGLMQFSFGWQLTAVFGGLLLLSLASMSMDYAAMATSSALSHFGLFAALQGGMFGEEAGLLIPFIFAMPFLVHPLVFFMFGRAMGSEGEMPRRPALILALIGLGGVVVALFL
ncbi:MAG: hypothetical protein EA425_17670 [Puniceicoccaceae bacterium]|nr:MAG: hypothetical protein EA425_17670 [Puniceicoccaceae bacterium]